MSKNSKKNENPITKQKKRQRSESPAKKRTKVSSTNDENSSADQNKKAKEEKSVVMKFSQRQSISGNSSNLKIVSWNVNGIRSWLNSSGREYLEKESADIVCFQELKCDKEKIPPEIVPKGFKGFWLSGDQAGYSGVGLMTRIDPIDVRYGIGIEKHDNEGRIITAEFEKFFLVVSYIPNSGRKLVRLSYRQEFNRDFRVFLNELNQRKPVVWCGDLNVSHKEIDLSNPKTNTKNAGFTKEERDDFSKILDDGFVDSYRFLYPDQRDVFTFWAYFRNARARNIGWRLDYFVISDRLKENLCDVLIQDQISGSDHCPIVLFLSL